MWLRNLREVWKKLHFLVDAQPCLSEFLENQLVVTKVLVPRWRVDDVIQVNKTDVASQLSQGPFHQLLKGCWCIFETKGQGQVKVFFVSAVLIHQALPVTTIEIDGGEYNRASQ